MLLILTLVLCVILFSACSPSTDEAPMDQKSRVTVDFSTFQLDVEDMSRSSRAALSTAATRLSFAVFNAKGNLVNAIHQESKEANFGRVQMELSSGTYTMVAVAHSGSADAIITSATSVELPGTIFTDTFTKVQKLIVESNKDCSCSMTLDRITSAFILRVTDNPPTTVKEIEVVLNFGGIAPTSLKINPTTGCAENNWKQNSTIPVESISTGVPIYFIGMNSSAMVMVKAIAKGENGAEIISHLINEIPLARNQKTIASGKFFTPKVSGTFTIENWGADKNLTY